MILIVRSNNITKLLDLQKAEMVEITKEPNNPRYYLNVVFQNWHFTKQINIKDEHVEVLGQYFAVMKNKEAIEDLEKLLEKLR